MSNTTTQQNVANEAFNPALLAVRKLGSSKTFATVVIGQISYVILGILLGVFGGWALMSLVYSLPEILNLLGYSDYQEYYRVFMVLETIALFLPVLGGILSLIGFTPAIINTVSLCVIRTGAKKSEKPMKTGAFIVLIVMSIISLSVYILSALWSFIQSVLSIISQLTVGVVSMGFGEELAEMGIGIGVMLIIEIAVLVISLLLDVFVIVYYLKYIKTINSVRTIIKTGKIGKLPSRLVGIMCYISGTLCVLFALVITILLIPGGALLSSITTRDIPLAVFCITAILYFIAGAVTSISSGVLIFRTRSRLEEIQYYENAQPTEPVTVPEEIAEVPGQVSAEEQTAEADEPEAVSEEGENSPEEAEEVPVE